MKLGVLKEKISNEKRVAITPDLIDDYIKLGFTVEVEAGAGKLANFDDSAYTKAGAKVVKNPTTIIKHADLLLSVQAPKATEVNSMKAGSTLVGLLGGLSDIKLIEKSARKKINAFSMELVPRITRAQSMDALSSQSNLAGYRAVIDAVAEYDRATPLMMTAAGRINPAKVLILGAGVAGLQAIATARRLGAIVSAFDVRPAAREQVESLGASFIEVESDESEDAETTGGYAKEMSDDYKKKQAELIHDTALTHDIVICTALIPGRPAPLLLAEKTVKAMQSGSVIVDLAVANGGNCALSQKDKVVEQNGVKIIGYENMPARVAPDASRLYAKNLLNFITPLVHQDEKKIAVNLEDEIIQGALLTYEGKIVHPQFQGVKEDVGTKPSHTRRKRAVKKSSGTNKPKRRTNRKTARPKG